ncbi:WD40 repeat protein [Nonlabens xylanidelens]|uniref:WD40 repeat protein n=1 Tax=Nonlabens xylanidelens TaxID=191564 RepID=A0A2S6IH72_9FLAO|nr:OmpA family protein [Nonlabens xylanidelens]PPK93546.1 WD40 repeat protein [Nonlabens xylanidelens]
MLKKLSILIILFAFSFGHAQKGKLDKGNEKFKSLAFIEAQKMYLEIVNNGYESVELFQKLGDTYYFNNDYKNAHKWYSKLFEYNQDTISKEYYFRYIQSLKAVGDYTKANDLLAKYRRINGDDNYIKEYANDVNYLELIELQSYRFSIVNEPINTKRQDFGTAYYRGTNKVVFASAKDSSSLVSRRHKWNDRQFLDLYEADMDSLTGELSNVTKFGNGGNEKLNTKFHESNAVFTKDGQTVYYSSNNYFNKNFKKSSDDVNKLKIFRAQKTSDGWGDIIELKINSDEFSTAHPALNIDESRLYFASDRPGSKVGLQGRVLSDIWYVDLNEDDELSEPVNVASINTAGNELFPFISDNGDLYFSSTGHMGLGGLDIFVTPLNKTYNKEKVTVTNIGKPVNGQHDDFSFIINDSTQMGYFSSNRPEGKGLDDIYRFVQNNPLVCKDIIQGVVTNEKTGLLMPDTQVNLLDADNKVIESVVVGKDAAYKFSVNCSSDYSIRALKEGYSPAEANTTTPNTVATIDLPLQISKSIDDRLKDVKEGDDLNDILDINMIYFDFDKHNIRPDAELELQKVLRYMKAYPTVSINIRSHTDSRAPDGYNIKLSDRRAKSTRAYLIMKGISADRLTARGYGEFQLVNECANGVECTEEQHQLNRRSEFIVTKR